jgi:CrcB protein
MRLFIMILAVGFGGAIGAIIRHLLASLFHGLMGLPEYVAIMIVNITGCFLIGFVFFVLEGVLKKDLDSPLKASDLSKPLTQRGWWPESNPTQPVVRDFKADLRAELFAGFIITGILGGMTTFSLFSLISLNLEQSGNHLALLINVLGSVTLGYAATCCGLLCGRRLVLLRANSSSRPI